MRRVGIIGSANDAYPFAILAQTRVSLAMILRPADTGALAN